MEGYIPDLTNESDCNGIIKRAYTDNIIIIIIIIIGACNINVIDVDECEAKSNNCHPNANCINNEGSFTCQCKPGYDGDGITDCHCK